MNDIATAVLAASRRERAHPIEVFNVGSGLSRTSAQSSNAFAASSHSPSISSFGALPYHPYEPMHLVADTAKLMQLGWAAGTPLSYAVWQLAQVQCPH